MTKKQAAAEFRKALQFYIATLTDEEMMMSIPSVFPEYKTGIRYDAGDKFSYGENSVGDPQLYLVLQSHTSAVEWPPDEAPSLYKAVGVTPGGIAVWVQPLGATDAYNRGDIVSHGGVIWSSTVDANVWEPGVYGWEAGL